MPQMQALLNTQPSSQTSIAGNSLGGNQTPTDGGLPPSFTNSRQTLADQHERNREMFKQTGEALKRIDVVRQALTRLSQKQDLINMDDIVEEAGKLVSHGIDPVALAGVLADAPQQGGGEALAGWIANRTQIATQGEQQMQVQHALAQHNMGVSAMHMLMAHANGQTLMPPAPTNGNGLAAQPPNEES
jgi:hypothetical protein